MPSLIRKIVVTGNEYRPCFVDKTRRALFHRWVKREDVCGASLMVGGHGAGQISFVQGIVELENGDVLEVSPHRIQFVDSDEKFRGVPWPDETDCGGMTDGTAD